MQDGDLFIPHFPFEALLHMETSPKERKHNKRPIIFLATQCIACLFCLGFYPTKALHEVALPPKAIQSPLVLSSEDPPTESVSRWRKKGLGWA